MHFITRFAVLYLLYGLVAHGTGVHLVRRENNLEVRKSEDDVNHREVVVGSKGELLASPAPPSGDLAKAAQPGGAAASPGGVVAPQGDAATSDAAGPAALSRPTNDTARPGLPAELGDLEPRFLPAGGLGHFVWTAANSAHQLLRRQEACGVMQGAAIVAVVIVVLSCIALGCALWDLEPKDVLFYSEKESGGARVVSTTAEPTAFLTTFNTPPRQVRLRIVGWRADADRGRVMSLLSHSPATLAFDAELDLSSFVRAEGILSEKDMAKVVRFTYTNNPMKVLLIRKQVEWHGMAELTWNIRQRLQSLGFAGKVDVLLEGEDCTLVCQNRWWPKFVKHAATQVMAAVTVVGGLFWIGYVWGRRKKVTVRSQFSIDVTAARYWDLISVGICPERGFRHK